MNKPIFVSNIVDFNQGRYFVDFAEETQAGELVVRERSFGNSNEATDFYKKLDEQINAQPITKTILDDIPE